jgi:hypothetical protein
MITNDMITKRSCVSGLTHDMERRKYTCGKDHIGAGLKRDYRWWRETRRQRKERIAGVKAVLACRDWIK